MELFKALCVLVVIGLVDQCLGDGQMCDEEVDQNTYTFAYGYNWFPYEYLDDDGELNGLSYDIARTVCKTMKKDCEHTVYYDYNDILNEKYFSKVLSKRWNDATMGWAETVNRRTAYSFFGTFATNKPAYVFVKSGSSIDSMQKLRWSNVTIGFQGSIWADIRCLQKHLGIKLTNVKYYANGRDVEEALLDGDVDAIFDDSTGFTKLHLMDRVEDQAVDCNEGGIAVMARKDVAHKFAWFDEGLVKMRANGDYDWLCKNNAKVQDPQCF